MKTQLAVIFDMDGVLVDTYRAHYQSWKDMAHAHGLDLTEAQFAPTFGRTSREAIAWVWNDRHFSPEQIAEMDAEKEIAFRRILAEDFPPMPGLDVLLTALRADGFRLAVGSSGPPENVDFVLDRLEAGHFFDAVVNGRDVRRGKPDPQVFLIAAQRLGVPPGRCAVVEDAPVGIQAAKAAGMAGIGLVSTGRTRQALAEADLVVNSLAELSPETVRAIIR